MVRSGCALVVVGGRWYCGCCSMSVNIHISLMLMWRPRDKIHTIDRVRVTLTWSCLRSQISDKSLDLTLMALASTMWH